MRTSGGGVGRPGRHRRVPPADRGDVSERAAPRPRRRRAPPAPARWLPALLLATGSALLACGDDGVGPDAPPGHTVSQDGVAHAPGLRSPATACADCHGADLGGGPDGEPSCFSCHGDVWS